MKTKKIRIRQGFTIVELVIVIGVIGVLSAVLIPTFINLNNKANRASDESLIKNLNTALAMQEQDPKDTKNVTMHDAVLDLKEYGYSLPNLVAKSGDKILWNQKTNRFLFESDDKGDQKPIEFWRIQDSVKGDEIYSIYAGLNFKGNGSDVSIVNVTVGFDAGENAGIKTINYARPGAASQTAAIRTNGGTLVVNAENDTVNHYGEGHVLDIQAIAGASYHEFGHFSKASIEQGRMVVENEGQVEVLNVTGPGVILDEVGTGSVDLCYATSNENIPTGTASVETTVADIDIDSIVARTENGAYETLSDALDHLGTSKTLFLVADIDETFTGSGSTMYAVTNDLTIDGQGYTVDANFVVNNDDTKIFMDVSNAKVTVKNINISGVGIKYIFVANDDSEMTFDNVSITADNAGISAAGSGHAVARNSTFKFVKGEHTRNDHQEAWAPVSAQYAGTLELFDCELNSSDGYGILVWPSGGTVEATRCTITSAKGYAVAWIRNGATTTPADSIIRVNECEFEGSTSCEAKYNGSSPEGREAYVYKDGVLVAATVLIGTGADPVNPPSENPGLPF